MITYGLFRVPPVQVVVLPQKLQPPTSFVTMSSWRTVFSYVNGIRTSGLLLKTKQYRYNKYSQICARAVRASFKEEHRVAAEKRGLTILRYQQWENGQGGQQVRFAFFGLGLGLGSMSPADWCNGVDSIDRRSCQGTRQSMIENHVGQTTYLTSRQDTYTL
jgi:Mitochondrial ATP synthase epsilon chain